MHPLSAFLAPWLREGVPDLDALNHIAAARGILTGGGAPLRFVLPADDGEGYEERAWRCGEVATRTDNRHDLFNALIWLAFPRSKAVMNRRHHEALLSVRAAGNEARGALRDALTQFDECGVVVAGNSRELWQALCAHRWREVFVERREELLAGTRFFVFGHASQDLLAAPFVGMCGKASDVAAFAKNAGPQSMRIDYLSGGVRLAFYTPDFFVRNTAGNYFLVETKGQIDKDVPLKARAAVEWRPRRDRCATRCADVLPARARRLAVLRHRME